MSKLWREHCEKIARQFNACEWLGDVDFRVEDMPGEHDPVILWMPNGGGLQFNHDNRPGVDMARAEWIAEACNQRLARERGEARFSQRDEPPPVDENAASLETLHPVFAGILAAHSHKQR